MMIASQSGSTVISKMMYPDEDSESAMSKEDAKQIFPTDEEEETKEKEQTKEKDKDETKDKDGGTTNDKEKDDKDEGDTEKKTVNSSLKVKMMAVTKLMQNKP